MTTAPRLRLAVDSSAGDWVVRGVGSFGSGVGGLVPHGFEAYGRILHPARGPGNTSVSWATVAAREAVSRGWGELVGRHRPSSLSNSRQWRSLAREGEGREDGGAAGTVRCPASDRQPAGVPRWATLCQPILDRIRPCPDRCWFCLWREATAGSNAGPPAMDWLLVSGRARSQTHERAWDGPPATAFTFTPGRHAPAPAGPRVSHSEPRLPSVRRPELEGASDMGDRSSGVLHPTIAEPLLANDKTNAARCVSVPRSTSTATYGRAAPHRLIADHTCATNVHGRVRSESEVTDEVWAIRATTVNLVTRRAAPTD